MTTQEMTKQEMIMNLREKREEKKKAKLKAKHRRCAIAIITLVAMMTVIFGSVYSASAKEITITEINEFAGTNETKTVKTRSESVEGALEEHGVNVSDTDKINVSTEKPVEDNENIVIKRGKRVTIKVGESEEVVTVTKADVKDALVEAGYIPGEYDQISSNGDNVASSDTIELVSVSHTDETETEVIPKGVEYVDDSTLIKGQEKVVDEGQDGVKTITYKVTYQDGQEATREVIDEQVTTEMRNKVIANGTMEPTPAPKNTTVKDTFAAKSTVSDDGGTVNGYKYKKKITMTATAYSTSPSENGGYTVSAMGNPLGYGIVAVDPSIVPLGSKVYVTSADGSWSYGVASAEDTGGAIKGNKIDLCYNSNANDFGRRSCVVYILD